MPSKRTGGGKRRHRFTRDWNLWMKRTRVEKIRRLNGVVRAFLRNNSIKRITGVKIAQ